MSESELAEDFLPGYDVSDAVARVVEADREVTWQALLDVDLLKLGCSAPLVGMLGALRMLPEVVGHLLHRERPAKPPDSMRLRDLPSMPMYEGGWILLRERAAWADAAGLGAVVSAGGLRTWALRGPEPRHQSTRSGAAALAAAPAGEPAGRADQLHRPAQRPSLHDPGRLRNGRASGDDQRRLA